MHNQIHGVSTDFLHIKEFLPVVFAIKFPKIHLPLKSEEILILEYLEQTLRNDKKKTKHLLIFPSTLLWNNWQSYIPSCISVSEVSDCNRLSVLVVD